MVRKAIGITVFIAGIAMLGAGIYYGVTEGHWGLTFKSLFVVAITSGIAVNILSKRPWWVKVDK